MSGEDWRATPDDVRRHVRDGVFDVLGALCAYSLRRSEDPAGFDAKVGSVPDGRLLIDAVARLDALPSESRALARVWYEAYVRLLQLRQTMTLLELRVADDEGLVGVARSSGLRLEDPK